MEKRYRLGDWKVDTILGKGRRNLFITLTDRESRFTCTYKVVQKIAQEVTDPLIELLHAWEACVFMILRTKAKNLSSFNVLAQR